MDKRTAWFTIGIAATLVASACTGVTEPPATAGPRSAVPATSATETRRTTTTAGREVGTDEPFPLDLGGTSGAPSTYKGLPLVMADNGEPDITTVDGVIGVVCIGMSNSSQECQTFIETQLENVAPEVRVVNCAVGGNAIERWNDPANDERLWDACLERKAPAAGVQPDQIRVVWHKAASQFTVDESGSVLPAYPDPDSDYYRFYESLTVFAEKLHQEIPSVQAVYTSSRSYGGFSSKPGRGEPLSFEEGLSLNRWLADHTTVEGVWYGWGPYLWAPGCPSGETNGSGLCYERSDYRDDGVHPSEEGRVKIAELIFQRFTEETWFSGA